MEFTTARQPLTIMDCDRMAMVMLNRLMVEHKADYLNPTHPDMVKLNAWYLELTNTVLSGNGGTGYEDKGIVLGDNVKVDEAGKRVCRVDGCGRELVKKVGRGRWPVECREGEGCKVKGESVSESVNVDGYPEPVGKEGTIFNPCTLCDCAKGGQCVCGKNCSHPTHK